MSLSLSSGLIKSERPKSINFIGECSSLVLNRKFSGFRSR
uniref:Uncharacterized protein n=1 Tax=Arundo donax TaxID=35708 RepID=A0A0A9ET14_ARUDO